MWSAAGWGGDSGGATRSLARPSSPLQKRRPENCQDDRFQAESSANGVALTNLILTVVAKPPTEPNRSPMVCSSGPISGNIGSHRRLLDAGVARSNTDDARPVLIGLSVRHGR